MISANNDPMAALAATMTDAAKSRQEKMNNLLTHRRTSPVENNLLKAGQADSVKIKKAKAAAAKTQQEVMNTLLMNNLIVPGGTKIDKSVLDAFA